MPIVWIPSLLRDLTQGKESIEVPGTNVGEVVAALDRAFPGVTARLCNSAGLKSGIAVAVDTQIARLGLAQPVTEKSEVHFLPAIGGG
jgi:molybdopterin synthase sulfur carrier subunit